MTANQVVKFDIDTVTRQEFAQKLGTSWKTISMIIEENKLTMPESIAYERHRGYLYVLSDMEQWVKDCQIMEKLAERKQKLVDDKRKGLDNQMASDYLRRPKVHPWKR